MADTEIELVVDWLRRQPGLAVRVGKLLRNAIDGVLDGVHTGRYDIGQLDNVVKTHIGSWVESLFLKEFPSAEIRGAGH